MVKVLDITNNIVDVALTEQIVPPSPVLPEHVTNLEAMIHRRSESLRQMDGKLQSYDKALKGLIQRVEILERGTIEKPTEKPKRKSVDKSID